MSRLTDLIRQAKALDEALGADIEAELGSLSERRVFGLNFERHHPETVELPQRPVRNGDKVRIVPARGSAGGADERLWRVTGIETADGKRVGKLVLLRADETELRDAPIEDLVVVAEFRDPIFPGLVSTDRIERGGDKPFHIVVNAENFHALQMLLYTHRGRADCIYLDPPYNTGAKDWKYNNDYVDGEDLYRHSKWLAFMERRLLMAKELLNPEDSVLIVTIDEKEYLRLGLLLEQTFPEARIQMVSSVVNRKGVPRRLEFARVDEYLFFVMFGKAGPGWIGHDMLSDPRPVARQGEVVTWIGLRRRGSEWRRSDRPGSFYPIYVDAVTARVLKVGAPIPLDQPRESVPDEPGCVTVWPLNSRGEESRWQLAPENLMAMVEQGFVRSSFQARTGGVTLEYLSEGQRDQIDGGLIEIVGRDAGGAVIARHINSRLAQAKTVWNLDSHGATAYGTQLVHAMLSGRRFPYPKSLYAVEDTLRFFVADKPQAVVVDFFAGSGTTAHALMRLNRQDGGRRQSVSITNNEVSADEQGSLRNAGLRPGDHKWEERGICEFITKPRLRAAVTGMSPTGEPLSGAYKFVDEFPMRDGFDENVEALTLTYESPWRVARNRAFAAVAPMLWLRAGAQGRRIESMRSGWDVAENYGVIEDLDQATPFLNKLSATASVRVAFIVSDDERRFQMICAGLPADVEPVRLYESYLRNFELSWE